MSYHLIYIYCGSDISYIICFFCRWKVFKMSYASTENVVAQSSTWAATSLFYALLVPAILLWYTYWRMSRRHLYELAEKIPGPKGLPIFGNALEFTGGSARKYLLKNNEFACIHYFTLMLIRRLINIIRKF